MDDTSNYFTAPSLCKKFLPFGEQSLFYLFGVHVQWGPDGTAGPHGGRAGAGDVRTHCGRGGSSGRTPFFRRNLMGDP